MPLRKTDMLKLKFPVIHSLEYMDLVKDRVNVLTIDGKDVEGFTWRQLQLYCGDRLAAGTYGYSLKFAKDLTIYRGSIKVLSINKQGVQMEDKDLKKQLDEMSKKINSLKTDSPGMDVIIAITKQGYETQIGFLKDELSRKEKNIDKLENEISKLNDQLDASESIIDDLKSKTGLNQYISIAKEFLMMKAGSVKPISNLKDSDTTDIPGEILQVLGVVDWKAVDARLLVEIVNYLKIFIQKLPLKGGDQNV